MEMDASDAARLLTWVRSTLGSNRIGFAVPPTRLTGGYDTAVWAFELGGAPLAEWRQPLVVRVLETSGARRARFEATVQNAIAALPYPCPPVLAMEADESVLGGAFLVMPKIPGRQLVDAIYHPAGPFRVPRLLARSAARLHSHAAGPVLEALAEAGFVDVPVGTAAWLERLAPDVAMGGPGFRPGYDWLLANAPSPPPQPAIVHADFHPLNLLSDGRRVTGVVDWPNVVFGDPAADVGFTRVLITMGPIDAGWLQPVNRTARRWIAARFDREYRRLRPLARSRIAYFEAYRCYIAMLHATLSGSPGFDRGSHAYAWDGPEQVRQMTAHFERISGAALPGPPARPEA